MFTNLLYQAVPLFIVFTVGLYLWQVILAFHLGSCNEFHFEITLCTFSGSQEL